MKRTVLLMIPSLVVLLGGCGGGQESSGAARVTLGEAEAGDLRVELLGDGQLATGLAPLHLRITTAAGQPVTDADVSLAPLMTMADGTAHSAPVIGAPELGDDGLYHGAVVLQMASSAADVWSLGVEVARPGAAGAQAVFNGLSVSDSGRARVFHFTDSVSGTETGYVSSLNFVTAPRIGLNPVIFTLHARQDMMTFPPVDDATVALDPQMPSMGHGSPGSVDPTPTTFGRYEGQLSLSMAGTWEVTVTVGRDGVVVGRPVFTVTF